jgi:hypothetical protein
VFPRRSGKPMPQSIKEDIMRVRSVALFPVESFSTSVFSLPSCVCGKRSRHSVSSLGLNVARPGSRMINRRRENATQCNPVPPPLAVGRVLFGAGTSSSCFLDGSRSRNFITLLHTCSSRHLGLRPSSGSPCCCYRSRCRRGGMTCLCCICGFRVRCRRRRCRR